MSSWTTPTTWVSGILTAAGLNGLRDNLNYLKDVLDLHGMTSSSTRSSVKTRRFGVRITNSADITVADATDKVLTWDNEDVDSTPGFHSTTTNTARIVIPSGGDGDYLVLAHVRFVADADGYRRLWFEVNGSAGSGTHYGINDSASSGAGTQTYVSTSAYIPALTAGDYITCNVRHTAGGSLDVGLSGGSGQSFEAYRVSST